MGENRINIRELAKKLNLSISTVSRALNGSYEIADDTKKKVCEMARKLNYQPNVYASGLRKQKSKTIGVIIPEIANNFFSLAINGIESVARDKGYHVLIYLTHEEIAKEIEIVQHLQNGRVDGVLMSLSSETNNISHIQELLSKNVRVVFFDRVFEDINTPTITTDDYDSSYKATEHLIERGCKKIAYCANSVNLSTSNSRMQGYMNALKKHNYVAEDRLILQCTNDAKKNYDLIYNLLNCQDRPDGIFASIEKIAISTYHVCADLGIVIPNELKIVGFSNLEIASLLNPSLTTVTQPAFEIGREAATVLFNMLEKKRGKRPIEKKVLRSTLITRNSTR